MVDKRKVVRGGLIATKVYDKLGNALLGNVRNLSRGGMFVSTIKPRPEGQEIEIFFELPYSNIRIECRCLVIWSRPFSTKLKDDPGMGVRFVDLDPRMGERIDRWAYENT